MAGTVKADTIQSELTSPTVFRNSSGTEIGRLSRSWTNYTGGTQVVNGSFNVSSVTRSSTGVYVSTYTTALSTSAYSATASNNSWACYVGTFQTTSYTIGAFITTSGSAADYQVFGMVVL